MTERAITPHGGEPPADPIAEETAPGTQSRLASSDGVTLTVHIPMRLHRRGGRKRILAPDGSELAPPARPQPDGVLVNALARAWRWQGQLDAGTYPSLSAIAEAERLNKSYVSRILRLATLAPDLVEAILAGTLDGAVMLATLEGPLPADWDEQRAMAGACIRASG